MNGYNDGLTPKQKKCLFHILAEERKKGRVRISFPYRKEGDIGPIRVQGLGLRIESGIKIRQSDGEFFLQQDAEDAFPPSPESTGGPITLWMVGHGYPLDANLECRDEALFERAMQEIAQWVKELEKEKELED